MIPFTLLEQGNIEQIKAFILTSKENGEPFVNTQELSPLDIFKIMAPYLEKNQSLQDFDDIMSFVFQSLSIQANNDITAFLAQNNCQKIYHYYMNHTQAKALWLMDVITHNEKRLAFFPYLGSSQELLNEDIFSESNLNNDISNLVNNIITNITTQSTYDDLVKQFRALNFNEAGNQTLSYSEYMSYALIKVFTDPSLILPIQYIEPIYSDNYLFNCQNKSIVESKLNELVQKYHLKHLQFDRSLNGLEMLYKIEENLLTVKEFFQLEDHEVGEDLLSFTVHTNDTYLGSNHIHDDITSGLYALQAKAMLSSPALRKSTFLHEYTHFRQSLAFDFQTFQETFSLVYDILRNHDTNKDELVQLVIDSIKQKIYHTEELEQLIHTMLDNYETFSNMKEQFSSVIEKEIMPNNDVHNVLFHLQTRLEAYQEKENKSFESEFLHRLDNQQISQSYWERADEVHARMNEAALDFEAHYHSMYEFTRSAFENARPHLTIFNQLLIDNYRIIKKQILFNKLQNQNTEIENKKRISF